MKRALTLLLLGLLFAPAAVAQPVLDHGKPISCPDPSVVDAAVGHYRYYLVCTTDAGADAFPIRASNDLIHWRLLGYVFPHRKQPWWALPSPAGRYWAPAIYRIDNRWVVYFAAQFNGHRVRLPGNPPGSWVVGVASSRSLSGPWQTKILHYRGQFNAVDPEQENYGGVIDPSVVLDPRTGQTYLFWAEQSSSIWVGELSADGWTLQPHVHQAIWTLPGTWECTNTCTVEGPEEYYRDGWFFLLYSGASTWNASYGVGLAASQNPMVGQFARLAPGPILVSGHGWLGPGGTSHPVLGPDGRSYLFYHAALRPNPHHASSQRYLLYSPIIWSGVGGYFPLIGDGTAG
jgi:beta-xylosidase